MKFRVVCVALAVCLGLSACKEEQRGYFELGLDERPVLISFAGSVGANLKSNYVSIAPIGQQQYVLANYENLILFRRDSASLCQLDASNADGEPFATKAAAGRIFNPTGVYVGSEGHLYVANYKGNNILEGRVDPTACTFVVTGEFGSADTLGPENVVVDNESGLLLSANYDAGTIVAFDIQTKQQVWVASVSQAHGVTVAHGKVFATGLTERKLYELDVKSGKVLRSKGGIGWDPMSAQFMWPTSIYPLKDGNLVISDPQSGYVSIVDSKTLESIRYTGGNGPAHNLLNYPYAAVPDGDDLIVLSSMRGSMFVLKQEDMSVERKYSFSEEKWPESAKALPIFGQGWSDYKDMSGYVMKVAGGDYRLGFGLLYPVGAGSVLKIPDTGSLFNPASYIYFAQGYTSGDVGLLFSSSSSTMLGLLSREGLPTVLVPKVVNVDSWRINDDLVSGKAGSLPFKYLVDEVRGTADAYYEYLGRRGWVDAEHLYALLDFEMMGLDYAMFNRYLESAFVSPAGREFKLIYDRCQVRGCDISGLKVAARNYYNDVASSSYIQMDEYALVGMVAGVSITGASELSVGFDDCADGRYYEGYGVEALRSDKLDDYLSAVDLERSNVCFTAKAEGIVKGVEAVWNDQATAPRSLEVYGEAGKAESGQSQWRLIGKYSDIKPVDRNGYAVSDLKFDNPDRFTRFRLKVTDGGVQHRLIMRKLSPVVSKVDSTGARFGEPYAFISCASAQTYPGYGIDALKTKSLSDYYSAVSKEKSSVCLSSDARRELTGFTLGWYAESEAARRVEIFAAKDSEFKKEVSLGSYVVPKSYEISGYHFSDVSIRSNSVYPFYRVKLLEGMGQERLILRSVTPLYSSRSADGDGELRSLAVSVSAEFEYGAGISKVDSVRGKKLDDIEKMIGAAVDAHCGNYALVFVNRLPEGASWRVFDLSTRDGRVHSVVEVKRKGRTFVYDPTLGVEYRCTLESMLKGECNYSADLSYYQVNPALQLFRGAGFFYGATVNRMYSSTEDLMSAYF